MKVSIMLEVNGTEVKVLSTEVVESEVIIGEEAPSIYTRLFDEASVMWTKDAAYNKIFLMRTQTYFNDLLKFKGHLFLNAVYESLGIPPSKEGQVVGWIYDTENPVGDNYVDFGLMSEKNRDFRNGITNVAVLDFNVDGDILSRI